MRVTPLAKSENPVYLTQGFALPKFPAELKGDGVLAGGFDLGPGRYAVEWMMRDSRERVCSARWEVEAKSGSQRKVLPLTLKPNTVVERAASTFEKGNAGWASGRRLHLKILLNLSPVYSKQSILTPEDTMVLLSILRGITEQPDVSGFDLLAFNMREQKIVYTENNVAKVDYSAVEHALRASKAGTIAYRLLLDPLSETKFLTQLLTKQLRIREPSADAIVIVGAKVTLQKRVPLRPLRENESPSCPIYYLNYNPDPSEQPWSDTIGSALKAYRTAVAYNLISPSDLAAAVKDILSRTGKENAFSGRLEESGPDRAFTKRQNPSE
jgi:hypothetical protein